MVTEASPVIDGVAVRLVPIVVAAVDGVPAVVACHTPPLLSTVVDDAFKLRVDITPLLVITGCAHGAVSQDASVSWKGQR